MNSNKDAKSIVREAVAIASLDQRSSLFQLTVRDVETIATCINDVLEREGLDVIRRFVPRLEDDKQIMSDLDAAISNMEELQKTSPLNFGV